ncbi:MAG: hypothetical protein JNN30_02365 [Rhodanobacteraceae bacterium]|nr:hypothetical protein [Rhodanobacteraceae bacterium]
MPSNRVFAALVAAVFVASAGIGAMLSRHAPALSAQAQESGSATAAAAEQPVAKKAASSAVLTTASTRQPVRKPPVAQALPAADMPVVAVFDELAARARAGDATAARRLADDLQHCRHGFRPLINIDAQDAHRTEAERQAIAAQLAAAKRSQPGGGEPDCSGVDALKTSAQEWIALAAQNGDPAAMLCYALSPNDWNENILSPSWQQHAELAFVQSPQLLQRAFDAGMPEAAAALAKMYMRPDDPAIDWRGRFGHDPYQAYAYALVAANALTGARHEIWSRHSRTLALPLSPEQRTSAQRWADTRRSHMTIPPLPRPVDLRPRGNCAQLAYMASLQ